MHSSIARYLTLAAVAALAAGCETDRPLGPNEGTPDARSSGAGNLAAPSNLTATAESYDLIILNWKDNTSSETAFQLRRSTTGPAGPFLLIATLGANSVGYGDGGLEASREHCYTVSVVVRNRVSAPSNTACATTPAKPTPPKPFAKPVTAVDVVPAGSIRADVSWADPSTNEAQFRVERSSGSAGPWGSVALLGQGQTFLRDVVPSEVQLCYRVIAVYAYGDAEPSSTDCTMTIAAPTNLTVSGGYQTVDLAWEDNSAIEDRYEVVRLTWDAACNYYCSPVIDNFGLPANSTSYRGTNIVSGPIYSYYVLAGKGTSTSDRSAEVFVVTAAAVEGVASFSAPPALRDAVSSWTGPGRRKATSSPAPARKR